MSSLIDSFDCAGETSMRFAGAMPDEIYQTWVSGRTQDSSTPEAVELALSAASARALALASGPSFDDDDDLDSDSSHDNPGGDLGRFFRVFLVRSDLKPVEAFDPATGGYAALMVPQSTFSFRRTRSGRVRMEIKRKHLPPSKNYGDVLFRLLVKLSFGPAGSSPFVVTTSSAFRILSKQSTSAPRPEPKRRRNPAPTKPFVASFAGEASEILAAARSAVDSPPSAASAAAALAPAPLSAAITTRPRRMAAERSMKRARDEANDDLDLGLDEDAASSERDVRIRTALTGAEGAVASSVPSAVLAAASASIPRAVKGSIFRFESTAADEDTDEEPTTPVPFITSRLPAGKVPLVTSRLNARLNAGPAPLGTARLPKALPRIHAFSSSAAAFIPLAESDSELSAHTDAALSDSDDAADSISVAEWDEPDSAPSVSIALSHSNRTTFGAAAAFSTQIARLASDAGSLMDGDAGSVTLPTASPAWSAVGASCKLGTFPDLGPAASVLAGPARSLAASVHSWGAVLPASGTKISTLISSGLGLV